MLGMVRLPPLQICPPRREPTAKVRRRSFWTSRPRLSAVCGLVLGASIVRAAPPATSSAPAHAVVTLADRAGDDGLQRLFDTLASLSVQCEATTRSVAAFLAASPDAERQFRQVVLAHRQVGAPRSPAPGITAVEVSITASAVEDALRQAAHALNDERPCEPRLAASSPPLISTTGRIADDGEPRDARPGWRHCTPAEVALALRAAESDLRQRVRTWLLLVPLANQQPVISLIREHPELERSLRDQVDRLAGGEAQHAPTGLCVITSTLSGEQLISLTERAMKDAGLDPTGERKPVSTAKRPIVVQGFGTAPPRPFAASGRVRQGPKPAWADKVLNRTAAATAPLDGGGDRKALAIKAATIEARRQLWLEVEKLTLPNGRTIGDAIADRSDSRPLIQAIDGAIFVMSQPAANEQGSATVTLAIRLETVWQILGGN